jgi:hypothetical protein
MAHYAYLNENNFVTQVIVGKDENEIVLDENENPIDWEIYYGAKRTSYSTWMGRHLNGGTPFRKNYAAIGYTYDESRDAFIPPKPYESWLLNEDTCHWDSPVAKPAEDFEFYLIWNEDTISWDKVKFE